MITKVQAIATILGIEISKTTPPYFYTNHDGVIRRIDGIIMEGPHALENACRDEIEFTDLGKVCKFAIFPVDSLRAEIYMMIEKESLMQEAAIGKPLIDCMVDNEHDPRQALETIFGSMRDAAKTVMQPQILVVMILRVCVVCVAGLQWTRRFLEKIINQQRSLTANLSIHEHSSH